MPRPMVHPRLKRILSETETASPTPTPDPQSDVGKLEPESEEQDAESEDKEIESAGDLEPNPPAESHSSMEISDVEVEQRKAATPVMDDTAHDPSSSFWAREGRDGVGTTRGDETPPASASQSTPRAVRTSKSTAAPSPTSQATKETSPDPPSTSASTNRSPAPQAQPRLKIKLRLGARPQPPPEGTKVGGRRKAKGKSKANTTLAFPSPSLNPTEASEASTHASAESEEADDADAESEDDAPAAQPDDLPSMDVDSRVPADDVESDGDGDAGEDDIYEAEVRSGSRGKLTARQAVLASMVGADHVELEAPTSSRKKNLTSEEIALRREETARKRKNMSEKKLEDEKTETINRLLKKQSSRSRAKRSALLSSVVPTPQSPHSGDDGESDAPAMTLPSMPGPAWRWVSSRTGLRLGIPPDVDLPPELAPTRPARPAVCDVAGCDAQRKYRLVRDFQRGACGMEHLRVLNDSMAAR